MKVRIWTVWIFISMLIKSSIGVEKYWLPNLEWETAENWIGERIPELDSYVTFPLDTRHAVGIGKSENLRLSGIDLARTGSLALPRNGRLQVQCVNFIYSLIYGNRLIINIDTHRSFWINTIRAMIN